MELELYVDAGLSPVQALRSATGDAAEALGAGSEIGRIAPGHRADLVILDGDPLEDIRQTRAIDRVLKNGQIVCTAGD
jgi:imidazolonepropionase-like amidohydrolase